MPAVPVFPPVQRVSGSENPAGRSTGSPAHGEERPSATDRAHGGDSQSFFLCVCVNINISFVIQRKHKTPEHHLEVRVKLNGARLTAHWQKESYLVSYRL